jgi:hypothetical protein
VNSNDTNAKTVDTNHRPSPAKASSVAFIVLQCLHLRGNRDLLAVADDSRQRQWLKWRKTTVEREGLCLNSHGQTQDNFKASHIKHTRESRPESLSGSKDSKQKYVV